MAEETPVDEGEGGGSIDFANVVAMLEKYFEVNVPDSVTDEATLDAFLAGLITTPGEATETETATEEETPAEVPVEAAPMYLNLKRKLDAANKRLALHEKTQKDTFRAEVESLIADNHITPADGKEILADADVSKSYSMSLLKPLRRLSKNALPTGGVARRLGAGSTEDKGKEAADAIKSRRESLLNGVFRT